MSIIIYHQRVLATDTLIVDKPIEDLDEKTRPVMPPSLHHSRSLLKGGGKVIDVGPWSVAVAADVPQAMERVKALLQAAGDDWNGNPELFAREGDLALPDMVSILVIHRAEGTVSFFKKRLTAEGRDASVWKQGLPAERPYAIGSGSWVAMEVLTQRRCDAVEAARQTCMRDTASGGEIHWRNLDSGETGTLPCPRVPSAAREETLSIQ